jgi:hypothetical protein
MILEVQIKMMSMKLLMIIFWIYFISPPFSILVNFLVYLTNIEKVNKKQSEKQTIKLQVLPSLLKKFKWKQLNLSNYTPSILTILINELSDNTVGSAILTQFWYKSNNIPSSILYIFNKDITIGHSICIRKDHTEFVSNDNIIKIKEPNNWIDEIDEFFNYEFCIFFE